MDIKGIGAKFWLPILFTFAGFLLSIVIMALLGTGVDEPLGGVIFFLTPSLSLITAVWLTN